jgi:hypothetical protein
MAFLDQLLDSHVVSFIVSAILTPLVKLLLIPRAKVAWGVSHQRAFAVPPQPARPAQDGQPEQAAQPGLMVYTREIWVQNVGRALAEGIEVVFATTPAHFNIWPQRSYLTHANPDGNYVIKVENLNRREWFTISMLQTVVEPPIVTNVRWAGGIAEQRPMQPTEILPRWKSVALQAVLLIGVFSILFLVIHFLLTGAFGL